MDRDLRKLNRAELIEMLIAQNKHVECLQAQLDEANKALADRNIQLEDAGSIAEAALNLNGVYEAAQRAADQYLANVKRIHDEQMTKSQTMIDEVEAKRKQMETEYEFKCHRMLAQARYDSEKMIASAKTESERMLREAKEGSESYWQEVATKLELFKAQHQELVQLLSLLNK